ncbi:unnamed protein product [Didymodactylos carnosus]|uniref:HAT C-terminal dimerisation domain-containing protein n=1 Tax=Didymodactylos carnosus TaxID=1234261 RepID=A0A814Q527_9BILA|nr:unnamed protein product [Didymodactylos carnosus]CAF3879478.1 unnamed protein product [Didymodactylos carnosus]
MRSPRIVLLSQLRPELIIKEKTLKLAKQLADKFADRLPSPFGRRTTLPVSTASAERSFIHLARIKSYARSTMKEGRLNGLAAAYIHKDIDIDPQEILTCYIQKHSRRLDFGF